MILALSLFLTRTRFGLAVRATSSNADTARVYGISPKTTSTIVWCISGALAGATAVLFAPRTLPNAAAAGTAALGAPLLLRAITVGLIARMRSLPMAIVGGLVVGVVEQAIVRNYDRTLVEMFLFVAVLVVVLFVGRSREDDASWSLTPEVRPIPERLKSIWWVRNLNLIGFGILFGFFAALGLVLDTATSLFLWSGITITAMVGISLSLLTGWGGQLSLGQFAFVGLGAMTMLTLTEGHEIPLLGRGFVLEWGVAVVVAVALGVIVAVIIGLPSLRVRGLYLAVTTLAFAVASAAWLFQQEVFTGGRSATRPIIKPVFGPIDFNESRRAYYWLCLLSLVIVSAIVAKLRRTGIGRSIIAVRENEDMAAASTVSGRRMKLLAFAVSGGIAAFAGVLFVTLQSSFQPATAFSPDASIRAVAIAIIGGLGSVAGPILGALWVQGIPALFDPTSPPQLVVLLTSSIGLLLLLMYFPGGLQQIVYKIRDALLDRVDRRLAAESAGAEPSSTSTRPAAALPVRHHPSPELEPGQPALETTGVSVSFGGLRAVDDVSLRVMPGEMVGLIGTNGAGKSTLLNAISGFVSSQGRIEVLGKPVDHMRASRRHALGLGRGFQAAKLYPELTVRETLMVSLEARERSLLVPSMFGIPPSRGAERRKRSEADELIMFLGLGAFAENYISGLSTGTRRIVELGSLLAVDARVLLLDEPTGGVAQKETEAFGPLIKRIQHELEASVVVIEHDMPLVMSISDRVYCLEAGAVIAEGSPDEVRNDPLVISSYLGTDDRAIERSDIES
jgi:ABC-type branched-subunit amino acid transport system ATPase component/ABC-type branched-subunit amino acid transport system permease subunit